MQILWRDRARRDVREIFQYILQDNPDAAWKIQTAVDKSVLMLSEQPGLGRIGRASRTRELVVARTPYIIAYTVDTREDTLVVLRVLHGSRSWPSEL